MIASRHKARGFTLVELLVVVGIIALLVSLSLPTYMGVMEVAREETCRNNLNLIAKAIVSYLNDEQHKDRLPANDPPNNPGVYKDVDANDLLPSADPKNRTMVWWCNKIYSYTDRRPGVFLCPSDPGRAAWADVACSYGYNETLTDDGAFTTHAIKDHNSTAIVGHCNNNDGRPAISDQLAASPENWPSGHRRRYDMDAGVDMGRCGFIMASGRIETYTYSQARKYRRVLFHPQP